jgi:hypothetical protein
VEWKLIEMPLPRLQRMGAASVDFVYEIGRNEKIVKSTVDRYAAGDTGAFDNRVRLKPGVGGHLLQLNGLLRPLIHRRWCAMVALLNKLEDSRLEEFLFGAERLPTVKVRAGLGDSGQAVLLLREAGAGLAERARGSLHPVGEISGQRHRESRSRRRRM